MKKTIKRINFFFVSVIMLSIGVFAAEKTVNTDPNLQDGLFINTAQADTTTGYVGDGDGAGGDGI